MKNIISKYINVEKPRKRLTESDKYFLSGLAVVSPNGMRDTFGTDIVNMFPFLKGANVEEVGYIDNGRYEGNSIYKFEDKNGSIEEKLRKNGFVISDKNGNILKEPYEDWSERIDEDDNITSSDDEIQVYMNTWKNYNSYGADLEAYGIKDGWMSLDDAIEFAEKYAEDEPFINDIENSPIEISEYDGIYRLQELKEYEDCDDKDVVKAILQSGHTDDISEAISIAKSGDYLWFPGVETDAELAEAYIDMCGGIMEAVGDNVNDYLDKQSYRDDIEDDVAHLYMQDNDLESIDDCYNEENEEDFNAFLDAVVDEDIVNGDLSNYFDYDAFGSELGYDFTFVDDGAIRIY